MTYPINVDHPEIYQSLILVIDEFEQAALRSETRQGVMVVANSPLTGMDAVLKGSQDALQAAQRSRRAREAAPITSGGGNLSGLVVEPFGANVTPAASDLNANQSGGAIPGLPEVSLEGGVSLDASLFDLFGEGVEADAIRHAIQDCLGCDLRIEFDWQLKPLNLLGPVQQMLDEINGALDTFENQLDPLQAIESFCRSMNDFSFICVPDWISMLISLKLLLRKYMSFNLNLKLDWTTILGPLLQLIIGGIQALIEGLVGIILAPLDCSINVLESFEDLAQAAQGLGQEVAMAGELLKENSSNQAVGRMRDQDPVDGLLRDVGWQQQNEPGSQTPNIGTLQATTRTDDQQQRAGAAFSFPVGGQVNAKGGLDQLMKDPAFRDQPISLQVTESLKEARTYVQQLSAKINRAMGSINSLVSGGLSIQLGNLGAMLFVRDMMAMVTVIIQLLSKNQGVADWCQWFEDNPQTFQDLLTPHFAPTSGTLSVETVGSRQLALTVGPYTRTVTTCISTRGVSEQHALSQWIKDLNREG